MEMMPRLRKLVDTLTERTKSGALKWRSTDEPDWYLYLSGNGSVLIGSANNDGQWPHGIRVLDESGVEVASFEESWRHDDLEEWASDELTALYEAAKDAEHRYANVIDGILAELEAVPA